MCGFPSKSSRRLLDLLSGKAAELPTSSPAKIINQAPGRAQIVFSVNLHCTIVERRVQRIDVHSRRQRFRKPFFQAGAKSPSQVVDCTFEKSPGARCKNHYA